MLSFQRPNHVLHDIIMVGLSWTGVILIRHNFVMTPGYLFDVDGNLPLIIHRANASAVVQRTASRHLAFCEYARRGEYFAGSALFGKCLQLL
ncbi:MAG: hypothetical protein R3E08_14315 [Thiotrichaceae bacterium]